jgi:amino acid transporter, AAT family
MSTIQTPPSSIEDVSPPPAAAEVAGRWLGFGLANLLVVIVGSVATWYLLADPELSPWNFYPHPFNAALFWAILFVVFIGFNAEFAGFNRLAQPWRGLAITAATAVFGVTVTWVLAEGLGRIDPDFAADRDGGLGYFTGALFVLFGFGTFVMAVLNWQHWPWPQLGLKQPAVGLAEIAAVAGPTMLLYFVIGLPSVSLAGTDPLMSVDTVLGWFYSVIVAVILTGQTLDNWPWRRVGGPARVALVSTIGNIVLGTVLYFAALPLIDALLGSVTTGALGDVVHQYPAQLGVCWAFWMIFWANAFGNRPTGLGTAANLVVRVVVTFSLAVATFIFYYRFAAEHILNEPAAGPGISGNALGFIDWMVLWTLLYVVGFESLGLRRLMRRNDPATD